MSLKAGIDVRIEGQGPDLLLLHSLLSDRTSFQPLVERLSPKRRLILVNLPGFGASAPADPIDGYADQVIAMLSEIGVPPTDVLGNGLGSFVALKMAADPRAQLGRLVLLGAGIAFPDAGRQTFRALAEKVERDGMGSVADAAMARMFPEDFISASPQVAAERKSVFMAIDAATFAAAARALAALDLSPILGNVRNPVLVAAGEKDGATPPLLGRSLADALSNGQFVQFPGIGHAPHIQAPDDVMRTIGPFLNIA